MARADRDWETLLHDPGFSPGRADLPGLLRVAIEGDKKLGQRAEKAIAKLGAVAIEEVRARLDAASGPERPRLVRLLGKLARAGESGQALRETLFTLLNDADPATRRQAIAGLGRLGGDDVVAALAPLAEREERPEHLRALAEALGRSHDPRARAALDRIAAAAASLGDPELDRLLREADVKLARGAARAVAGGFRIEAKPPRPLEVWLHVRAGLEELLIAELDGSLAPHSDAPGRVAATLAGPLQLLSAPRIALRFGFPVAEERDANVEVAVARSLGSAAAWEIVAAFSEGPIRYRIEWAEGGRHRAGNLRIAEAVAKLRPEMINDPQASDWEALVRERPGAVKIELWPRGLADDRFAYRKALLPAGSHPTLAAALARAARVTDDDVVWDPFVGSATELIECARLAPNARLFGCDSDAAAVEAARENLAAAGVRAEIVRMDARRYRPSAAPTLVISNPPMGRRVLDGRTLDELFAKVIARAAEVLTRKGRMVWLSPLPRETASEAAKHGLVLTGQRRVDMGGFWAELQRFERSL